MELVWLENGEYGRYEELLWQRDRLEKEAYEYQLAYTREFGDLAVEAFQLKIDCIALKKSIAFAIAARNRGAAPDPEAMQQMLARQMAAYMARLEEMTAERDMAQKGRPITPYEVSEIKRIYRRIAKLLHPDISPLTEHIPRLGELFHRVMIAYRYNDLKELRDLEALIHAVLDEHGIDTVAVSVPNLGQRIRQLEEEIEQILHTEPYLYRDLLADAFRMEETERAMKDEIAQYTEYKKKLQLQLDELMGGKENGR